MESEFEKNLHRVKPKGLTGDEKAMLWSNIEQSVEAEDLIQAHKNVVIGPFNLFLNIKKIRFMIAAILTGTLLVGSFATVAFADNSRPGDFLFPVELASENLRLRLTSPDNRDELYVQFASERLEEVKELLALANINFEELEYTAGTSTDDTSTSTDDTSTDTATTTEETANDDTATSTDDGSDTDDSASTTTDETATTTQSTEDDESDTDTTTDDDSNAATQVDTEALAQASNAFLIALQYLENTRDSLIANGNDIAVIAVNAFISELTFLADNHVDDIERARFVVDNDPSGDSQKVSIAIQASIDNVRTQFNFRETIHENGNTVQNIAIKDGNGSSNLRVTENRTVYEIKNDNNNKDDEDDDDSKSSKITVCYKSDTKLVKSKDISKYLKKGATFGECEDDDDDGDDGDEDDDKKLYICHKDKETIHVSKYSKWAHIRHGDEAGKCNEIDDKDDDDDDDNDDDNDAPEISDIDVDENKASANVSWKTNENATSKVWYGTESGFEAGGSTDFVSSGTLKETHLLTINGLTASTTYYFKVESSDESGNKAISDEDQFTTLSEPEPVDDTPPIITGIAINPTTTEATAAWITDEPTTGVIWYSEFSPVDIEGATDGKLSSTLKTSHSVDILSLTPDTTYYYIVVATDDTENTATSTEASFDTTSLPDPVDDTAPIISDITATPTTTEATVVFNTDEDSTSILWYGLTSGSLDLNVSDLTLESAHSIDLTGLTEDTTYYFEIVATDDSGNTSTSTEDSFTTLPTPPPPDETAPIISSIAAVVASTTADVSFTTDEDATSKIYYSLVTPTDLDTADFMENISLNTSHDFNLSGLATSTTYYFIVTATDESNNSASAAEDSFTTL